MDYKAETLRTYETFPDEFDESFEGYKPKIVTEMNMFLSLITGNRILDIGSGPGNLSVYYAQRGYDVLCVDISPEMVKKCQEKGLEARVMDFENLDEEDIGKFDGISAYTSLLHTPKANMQRILENLSRQLNPEGILFLGMKEGDTEGFTERGKYPGVKTWFSLYQDEELRGILDDYFEIESFSRTPVNEDTTFLNYICRFKPISP